MQYYITVEEINLHISSTTHSTFKDTHIITVGLYFFKLAKIPVLKVVFQNSEIRLSKNFSVSLQDILIPMIPVSFPYVEN